MAEIKISARFFAVNEEYKLSEFSLSDIPTVVG
jgi:hypothetical protein